MSPEFVEQTWWLDPEFVPVGVLDGKVVAFTLLGPDNGLLWMHYAYAMQEHRKSGLPKAVFDHLIRTFSGRHYVKFATVTHPDNRAANLFMRFAGCRHAATLTNHWFGADYHCWERPLDPVEPYTGQDKPLGFRRRQIIRLKHAWRRRFPG